MGHPLLLRVLIAALVVPVGSAQRLTSRMALRIEVLGTDGTTVSQMVTLSADQSSTIKSLWLQVHGLRYAGQGSVQINGGPWIPLQNDTVTVADPGKAFGGIGGALATLVLTLPLQDGALVPGSNTLQFRFNHSDGLSSGYRVVAWNFLTANGSKVFSQGDFVEDAPEAWTAPRPDGASIRAGRELWFGARLFASSLKNSPRIQAHCADCHARDGRDLKYFNYSNASIIVRSRFHGLTTQEGEQIASYIRSLALPNPGRPWNPPYQPGPGLDKEPVSSWSAGAGLAWILDKDSDALPYLIARPGAIEANPRPIIGGSDFHKLARQITSDVFHPDGNLNAREIPVGLQLPDWNQWLPRIHPMDAWGPAFKKSQVAAMYDSGAESRAGLGAKTSLRAALQTATSARGTGPVAAAFAQWSQARRNFLGPYVKAKKSWSSELSTRIYSTQLWQLVKTWEMTQEFGLEGRGDSLLGFAADSRTWRNTIPADTAPSATHIPNGPAGIGGCALTNEYLSASWYELQVILNNGNHRHHDRAPVDWVYLIGQYRDFYLQSHHPEPVRLLVAVTKAMQSTDSRLGPDDLSSGWRPDQNVDPRIVVSPRWAPLFKPFPFEVRRALTESLLRAWLDKTQQYSVAKYLPIPSVQRDYALPYEYLDFSGGKVWEAAEEFRAAGVSDDLLERLRAWGRVYTDRAARLQYH